MYRGVSPSMHRMSFEETATESKSQGDEMKGAKRKISLSNCGVCGFGEAKYKCPACLTHSCSLFCVKKHKEESRCSGVRNKTAFLNLSQFDEMTLLSDYRFLEDTGRFAGGAQRDGLLHVRHTSMKAKKLIVNARKMNITLRTLPSTFTKSKENSTIFNSSYYTTLNYVYNAEAIALRLQEKLSFPYNVKKEKLFLWHLKIVFPQSNTEFSQKRVCDRLSLEEILMPYIHPTESDPIIRQKLKRYVHVPIEDVNVFMKAEGLKANLVRYHKLDLQKSLRDNLRNKILIEYPLLHVVLSDHWNDFPLKEPAEPASANDKYATKGVAVDHASEDLALRSPSLLRSHTTRGNVFTAMRSSPESLPPQEKRLRRELGEEELEEGEIAESEDEDDNGENIGKNSTCDGATSKGDLVDEGTGNCIKDLSSVVNSMTARESAEVSMTE